LTRDQRENSTLKKMVLPTYTLQQKRHEKANCNIALVQHIHLCNSFGITTV
jgi:hypothetical protein